jgi:hypothetical protein
MKNTALTLIVFIIIFSTVFSCKSQTNSSSDNFVKFKIDAPQKMDLRPSKFLVKDYRFPVKTASVMEGSNTGLVIEFFQNENEKSTLTLTFQLPSGNAFKVYTAGKGFSENTPPLPCTVTSEDFRGIKSARAGRDVIAYISLSRNTRTASDESSMEGVYFEIFSITIKEFNFIKDKINISCEFSGSLSETQKAVQDTDYKITGSFNLKDFGAGVMMVDD